MRGNDFLDKMELIDPAFIEAADNKPQKKKISWVKWGVVAACFCLVVTSAVVMPGMLNSPFPPDSNPETSNTVKLTPITIPNQNEGGFGFEGYMYYDISELNNENPWNESMNISFLPVYKNGAYDESGAGVPKGMSEAEMMEKLNFIAASLNLKILSTEVVADGFIEINGNSVATNIHAKTNNGTIYVEADGNAVYFLPGEGLVLPDSYNFTHSETTDSEAENILSYFIGIYGNLLNFKNPKAVSSGSYNIHGEFMRDYMVYDAADSDLKSILNYNFHSVKFLPNTEGYLIAIEIRDCLSLAEKIGDYPIISAAEATERLISGDYLTSVPVEFPGAESIGKIELVYRTGRLEEMLLPYYRFYVQLPDEINRSAAKKGLKTYGAYYVPAIADEYIADMPIYDGSFN